MLPVNSKLSAVIPPLEIDSVLFSKCVLEQLSNLSSDDISTLNSFPALAPEGAMILTCSEEPGRTVSIVSVSGASPLTRIHTLSVSAIYGAKVFQ